MRLPQFSQILDSRGNPTIQALWPHTRPALLAMVPSGASTGTHEALELRDEGEAYAGKSVEKAVENASELAKRLSWEPADLRAADHSMIVADGTENKSRYGANAILANSILQAKLEALQREQEPYQLIADLAKAEPILPVPFANIINGGRHADNSLQLQEFMIVPWKAETFADATQQVAETVHVLKGIIAERYGGGQTAVGDEGGFAPKVATAKEACALLTEAAQAAGHDLAIAIDAAASEFFSEEGYRVSETEVLSAEQLEDYYLSLLEEFPIISLEDPFDQDDFTSFARLRKRIADSKLSCQVVGDDLTVTNVDRIKQAVLEHSCDCLLLKMNQIGSVTESVKAAKEATAADWNVMVSHRSGETEDAFLADLAVGLGVGQIKLGAPVRGERTAKYNRLLTLERLYGLTLARLRI